MECLRSREARGFESGHSLGGLIVGSTNKLRQQPLVALGCSRIASLEVWVCCIFGVWFWISAGLCPVPDFNEWSRVSCFISRPCMRSDEHNCQQASHG